MTTFRTPQVGEQWRLRPRPSPEWACPACGYIHGSDYPERAGLIVRVSLPAATLRCGRCGLVSPTPDGLVKIDQRSRSGLWLHVPQAWLEPQDERLADWGQEWLSDEQEARNKGAR